MNISMNTSSALAQSSSDVVGMTVLKKSIDIEAQTAMTLINAISQPQQQAVPSLSSHLGQNINITA